MCYLLNKLFFDGAGCGNPFVISTSGPGFGLGGGEGDGFGSFGIEISLLTIISNYFAFSYILFYHRWQTSAIYLFIASYYEVKGALAP